LLQIVTAKCRIKEARGEPKAEVLSSDIIAARLKQVLLSFGFAPHVRLFMLQRQSPHFYCLTFKRKGVKLPPMAARELRKEARGAAIEKLSARRAAEPDGVLDAEAQGDYAGEMPVSHRSSGSGGGGEVGAFDAREESSPDYAEEFDAESGRDAVAEHVKAFMVASAGDNDDASRGDEGQASDAEQQLADPPHVRTIRDGFMLLSLMQLSGRGRGAVSRRFPSGAA